jgi:predicted SpoU family rRNA methylase
MDEKPSCYFYRTPRATTAHTCLVARVFGFQSALCKECEEAAERVNGQQERSGEANPSGGPA